LEAYEQILKKHKIKDSEICYIGDDLIDLPILRKVGFSVAVPNAPSEVKNNVSYITSAPGGYGAVREVTEKILKSQGKWNEILSRYF
jgi:3-deoxy-D-manno-octulosonate 8-phosphate phosphatase (KDO 8-P phosphatase)